MTIINSKILTMEDCNYENGYIIIKDGKIAAVGDMRNMPPTVGKIIDARGVIVTPGLVEAHCHIGMWEDSLGFEGDDGNEETDPSAAYLRAIDAVNPQDKAFSEALLAGITTVVTGPGSANPIGGQLIAAKTAGRRIDCMTIKSPIAIKMAFGENPKKVYGEKECAPSTRMATAAVIRETLYKAKEYMDKLNTADPDDIPDYDFKLEPFIPLLNGEISVHAHAHRADDIFTAIRIAKEFNLKLVLVHCTDGHLIAEDLKSENVSVLCGPVFTDRSKPELKNHEPITPAILTKFGIPTAIITDHPETHIRYLNLSAALSCREGLPRDDALKAITLIPAKILGLDNRIGSIAPNKDADIVIWSHDPLDVRSKPKVVIVNGEISPLENHSLATL